MAALRQEGLQTPIGEDNKGFKMLAMMGYKHGDGSAPLEITLKAGRAGLGVDEARRLAEAEKLEEEQRRLQAARQDLQVKREGFRDINAQMFAERKVAGQLHTARQVCETLDRRNLGLEGSFMWPSDDEEEPQQEEGPGRAPQRDRDEDPSGTPPASGTLSSGAEHATHKEGEEEGDGGPERLRWLAAPPTERLASVLRHLRLAHLYCLFCGCDYPSASAMAEACPGPDEDLH
mmetsp:Transcript_25951/g.72668  ORF Transcript_25951/g.72668 Transcript_25951/m.72668 type:complete len:233 (+) Transcript_25951:119-817(+)